LLQQLGPTALSHSLHSHIHCTLTFTALAALSHSLHSHIHYCTLTFAALSQSLHPCLSQSPDLPHGADTICAPPQSHC
jgi:hypothetical protein